MAESDRGVALEGGAEEIAAAVQEASGALGNIALVQSGCARLLSSCVVKPVD